LKVISKVKQNYSSKAICVVKQREYMVLYIQLNPIHLRVIQRIKEVSKTHSEINSVDRNIA